MNSTTNVTIQIDALKQSLINFVKINGSIVIPSLSGIGFFLNFVALLSLLNPKFKQKKQLKYVIVNVTIETFICGALIFFTDELCFAQCTIFKPYSSQFFKVYLNFFLGNTLFLFTGFIEVCLTYDRYLTLKKTENWFTKESTFKYLIILFTIISILVFVPFLFAFAITESPNNPNLYYIQMISFGKTNIFSISIILVLGGIDLLVVTVLIILSWLVIKEFKVFKQNNIQESRIKITSNIFQIENELNDDRLFLNFFNNDNIESYIFSPIYLNLKLNQLYLFKIYAKNAVQLALKDKNSTWYYLKLEKDYIWTLNKSFDSIGHVNLLARTDINSTSFNAICSYCVI